jgi:hypothetical protein
MFIISDLTEVPIVFCNAISGTLALPKKKWKSIMSPLKKIDPMNVYLSLDL